MNMWKYLFYGISAFAFVFGFGEYFHGDEFFGNESIINAFLFAGALFLMREAYDTVEKRIRLYGGVGGAVLSVVLIIGNRLYTEGNLRTLFSTGAFVKAGIGFWGFAAVLGAILMLVLHHLVKVENLPMTKVWKFFRKPGAVAICLFLAWLPCYLAYYPGIFSYDVELQTGQALGYLTVNRWHPPLHTYFWRLCLMIERGVGIHALVCYSITQMLMLASAFSYTIHFLVKRGVNNWIVLGSFLFFALNPVIAIFSFVHTKDAMLAVFLVLYTVGLADFLADRQSYRKSIWKHAKLIIPAIFCCLLRNNMVYGIVLATVLMVCFQKKLWKQVLLWCGCILLGYGLINGPLYNALGVTKGSSGEMMSVPMQQLSYVVYCHEAELSAEDKAAIGAYLPVEELAERYNPRLADTVKGDFNSARLDEDPVAFLKMWASFLVRYPLEYIEAFLNLNLPYWYPDACSLDAYSRKAYIETHVMDTTEFGYEVVRESKIPWLLEKYSKVATYEVFLTKPIIANVFAIGTPIWVLLFGVLVVFLKNRRDMLLPLLPAIGLWCTFLLGPVSNFRYMYPIIVLYPVYIALILQTDKVRS